MNQIFALQVNGKKRVRLINEPAQNLVLAGAAPDVQYRQ
jgi:hypothetical protein